MPPDAGSQMTPAQAELILRGDVAARRLAGRKMIEEPGSVLRPASPRAAIEGDRRAPDPGGLQSREEAAAEQEVRAPGARDPQRRAALLGGDAPHARGRLRSLAPLPGRKLCLLVSDGFLVGAGTSEERTRDLRAIIDAATRSGTVVYAIDSHGLVGTAPTPRRARSWRRAPRTAGERSTARTTQLFRMTLESVAADTGGFLVYGTNDFDTGVKRMLGENDSYYLMAYEPANLKRDGKFRKIEVKRGAPRRLRRAHASRLPRARRQQARGEDRGGASGAGGPRPRRAASTRPRRARSSTPRAPRRRCR